MIRDNSGIRIIYLSGSLALPDEIAKTTWVTAESTESRYIKLRLCDNGPQGCAECQLCAFGRKYVQEHNYLLMQRKGG